MLQIYDVLKSARLIALILAGGVCASATAAAEKVCDLNDGYALSLSAYADEMQACLRDTQSHRSDLAQAVLEQMRQDRKARNLDGLALRASLNDAARAHGLDMSVRKFADHLDLEGRDHQYRIRTLDRTQLTGATGANVLITPADIDAEALYERIQADPQNRANMLHPQFTHVGIGIIEAGERLFVTILFTQMEGELNAALPLTVTGKQRIRATFKNPRDAAVGWMLTDATTHTAFAQGINPLLDSKRMRNGLATWLDITVESETSKKSVRGPMIAAK